jgi:hypothetical protein
MIRSFMGLSLAVLVLLGGCAEPEGPAVEVFLQIVRANAQTDTSDVKAFFIEVDGVGRAVAFDPDELQVRVLTAAPHSDTTFVVYACLSDACAAQLAAFVGCTVIDLAPSEVGIPVRVELAPIAPDLPAECEGLVAPNPR